MFANSSSSLTERNRKPPFGIRHGRAAPAGESFSEPASARQHLVHLHDRFDLRVIGDVAKYLRAMFGERFLKVLKRVELEIGDGEIGCLVTGRILVVSRFKPEGMASCVPRRRLLLLSLPDETESRAR
jgi:hypothetical protein